MEPRNVFFRAGVGMIIHRDHEVAFFERIKEPGHWQFPQGGMYQGESTKESMYRELQEETGLREEDVHSCHEVPFLVSYLYPRAVLDSLNNTGSNYIGQTQRWFILKLKDGVEIDLRQASDAELSDIKWIKPHQAIDEIIEFKRPEYTQLVDYFQSYIK